MRRRWAASLFIAVVVLGGVAFLGVQALGVFALPSPTLDRSREREMSVSRLQQGRSSGTIVLELKEKSGGRTLAFEVGELEARTIADELNRRTSERPLTFDLMRNLVQRLGGKVNRVVVNTATDTNYYAKVVLETSSGEVIVDSRPGDAIALAVRAGAPIFAHADVLEKSPGSATNR